MRARVREWESGRNCFVLWRFSTFDENICYWPFIMDFSGLMLGKGNFLLFPFPPLSRIVQC